MAITGKQIVRPKGESVLHMSHCHGNDLTFQRMHCVAVLLDCVRVSEDWAAIAVRLTGNCPASEDCGWQTGRLPSAQMLTAGVLVLFIDESRTSVGLGGLAWWLSPL